MENKLHIVASGCSFTHNYRMNISLPEMEDRWKNDPKEDYTWFHWLWRKLDKDAEFHNYGTITNDNKTICRSIFYKVNDLIFNENVNPKDIIVIAQWTTLTRNSFFISPSKYKENPKNDLTKLWLEKNDSHPHTNDFIKFGEKDYCYQHGYYYLTGGYNLTNHPGKVDEFCAHYLDSVMSKEERYIDWFDSLIGLLSWLEKVGVTKFHSFNMNNNFSKPALEARTPPFHIWDNPKFGTPYEQMIEQKKVENTWNSGLMIYDNPYVKMYSDRIDFDKYFWFFEENFVHSYGGIIEWSIRNFDYELSDGNYNLPKVLWREMNGMSIDAQKQYLEKSWYGHTSSILTHKFVNDVVLNWEIFK